MDKKLEKVMSMFNSQDQEMSKLGAIALFNMLPLPQFPEGLLFDVPSFYPGRRIYFITKGDMTMKVSYSYWTYAKDLYYIPISLNDVINLDNE